MQDKILATSEDGSIIYQQLTSKYLDEACDVTHKTLFSTGNVCKRIGVAQDAEASHELAQIPRMTATDGLTVIAIDKNTDKVVGVAFNKILLKSEQFYENFRSIFKNPKSLAVIEFIIETDNICNFFEHCHVDCLMEHLFLGVLPEYRKQGIAKKLSGISVDLAQKLYDGVNVKLSLDGEKMNLVPVPQVVTAIFTSFISQKIGEELGFVVAAERSNENLEVAGRILDNSDSNTPMIKVEYKKLHK